MDRACASVRPPKTSSSRGPQPASWKKVCVPLTTHLRWADAPGNLALSSRLTGLPQDSVANVSQVLTLDRDLLGESVGKLPRAKLALLLAGIDVILGR